MNINNALERLNRLNYLQMGSGETDYTFEIWWNSLSQSEHALLGLALLAGLLFAYQALFKDDSTIIY